MASARRSKVRPLRGKRAGVVPFSHLTEAGEVHMVDVGDKAITARRAVAWARVRMSPSTYQQLLRGRFPKGDVLAVVRVAAIAGAKRTSDLIPLCHPLPLTKVEVTIRLEGGMALIDVAAETRDRTGVEMEAMVGAATGALTLYDMIKSVDRAASFAVELREKSGGKSGPYRRRGRA